MITHVKNQRFRELLGIHEHKETLQIPVPTTRVFFRMWQMYMSQPSMFECLFQCSACLLSYKCHSILQVHQTERDWKIIIDFLLQCAANLSVTGFWREEFGYCHCHICPSLYTNLSLYKNPKPLNGFTRYVILCSTKINQHTPSLVKGINHLTTYILSCT